MRLIILMALCFLCAAAPIPKQAVKPPEKLNPHLLTGQWSYEWSNSKNGWIKFWMEPDDISLYYKAQHNPNSDIYYFGKVDVMGDEVTIHESWYTESSGNVGGVNLYRFKFDLSGWPTLKGNSSGSFQENETGIEFSMPVKFSNRTVAGKK